MSGGDSGTLSIVCYLDGSWIRSSVAWTWTNTLILDAGIVRSNNPLCQKASPKCDISLRAYNVWVIWSGKWAHSSPSNIGYFLRWKHLESSCFETFGWYLQLPLSYYTESIRSYFFSSKILWSLHSHFLLLPCGFVSSCHHSERRVHFYSQFM